MHSTSFVFLNLSCSHIPQVIAVMSNTEHMSTYTHVIPIHCMFYNFQYMQHYARKGQENYWRIKATVTCAILKSQQMSCSCTSV